MNTGFLVKLALLCFVTGSCTFCFAIESFVESFSGNGEFVASNGPLGFENPNWALIEEANLHGTGSFNGNGQYQIDVQNHNDAEGGAVLLWRNVLGVGSFEEHIAVRNVSIVPNEFGLGGSGVALQHFMQLGDNQESLNAHVFSRNPSGTEEYLFRVASQGFNSIVEFTPGPDVAISILFDQQNSTATFSLDIDLDEKNEPITLGPFPYDGPVSEAQLTRFAITSELDAVATGQVDFWSLLNVGGDFNQDGVLSSLDIDALNSAISLGNDDSEFDVNYDSQVDRFDRNFWVHELARTYFGDANLDGEFNTTDLVDVFVAGEYEDAIELNSTWATGDWNGDGDFTSRDLVFAFGDGGFEMGPREGVQSVPEPASGLLVAASTIWILVRRRH